MNIVCSLCGSSNIIFLEMVKIKDLIKMYNKMLNSDISSEFGDLKEMGFYKCTECDLRFFYPIVTGSEAFYEKLQKFDWYYLNEKNEYEFSRRFIKESDSVLEIGCGKGAFAKKIVAKSYIGLEFSTEAKIIAEQNGLHIVNEPIQEHSINNKNKYDVVCSFQVLEHVSNTRSFIESSLACLKSDGLLIYSIPSVDSFSKFVPNFILDMPPHHVSRWTDTSLKNLEKLFNIECIELWHEPLQQVHKRFYAETILFISLLNLFQIKSKIIDTSVNIKFFNIICSLFGKLLAHGLDDPDVLPHGISVTIIFRKRER